MLEITLSNDMFIRGDYEDMEQIVPLLQKNLTFDNPEFINAIRTKKWLSPDLRKKAKIHAFEIKRGGVSTPRGFWQRLKPFLKKNDIDYVVFNEMVSRPLKKKLKRRSPVKLRPYQKKAARLALKAREGVLEAPCGSGKTEMLTEIIYQLNQKTLVIVHTDDLMQQMRSRLHRAFGIKIGIIKQSTFDIQPITVASVQTLSRRKLSQKFLRQFGVVMLDESHHMPAESFSVVLKQFPARYRFGTTATTRRSDNLHGLMFATLGYRFFGVTYEELYKGGWLMPAEVKIIDTDFEYKYSSRQYHKLIDSLIKDEDRNSLIVSNMLNTRKKHNLVLSSRIEHLQILYNELILEKPELQKTSALLIGNMSRQERDDVIKRANEGKMHFIFATQLADEGLDIPRLDRLHLPYPSRALNKIQQQVGRIQRTHPGKKRCIVYDYRDPLNTTLLNQSSARISVYKATGCKVKTEKGPVEV